MSNFKKFICNILSGIRTGFLALDFSITPKAQGIEKDNDNSREITDDVAVKQMDAPPNLWGSLWFTVFMSVVVLGILRSISPEEWNNVREFLLVIVREWN